jgi:hypothetical protein
VKRKEIEGMIEGATNLWAEFFYGCAVAYMSTGVLSLDLSIRAAKAQTEGVREIFKFSRPFFSFAGQEG